MKQWSFDWPQALLVSLFFMWGVANSLNDVLIRQFQHAFNLNDFRASLVQSAFYAGYFFGAVPAAVVSRSKGYKTSVITGLCLFFLGAQLFLPSSRDGGNYEGFLVSLYLIAFGLAFLESAANPWVVVLAEAKQPGSGTQALNIAQSFNPLGLLTGVLIGKTCILHGPHLSQEDIEKMSAQEVAQYRAQEAAQVGPPYMVIGSVVGVVAFLFAVTQFDRASSQELPPFGLAQVRASVSRLWRRSGFALGISSQFCNAGGQVCVWSFVIRFVQNAIPGTVDKHAANFLLISLGLFMAGRFIASSLLSVCSEGRLMFIFACSASVCCAAAALSGGIVSVVALCTTSFFTSMLFPTIFGITLSCVGEADTEMGAGILVMSIAGAAVLPAAMGAVSDASSIATAYLVPAVCFLVPAFLGIEHASGAIVPAADSEQQPLRA